MLLRPEQRRTEPVFILDQRLVFRLLELALMGGRNRMTGLWNYDGTLELYKRLQEGLRRQGTIESEKIGFLVVDLQSLKTMNDVQGRDVGDQALKKTARLLGKSARSLEDVIGQVGGDEFLVCCRGGKTVADKIDKRLSDLLGSNKARFRARKKDGSTGYYKVEVHKATAEVAATADPATAINAVLDVLNKKGRKENMDVALIKERLRKLK